MIRLAASAVAAAAMTALLLVVAAQLVRERPQREAVVVTTPVSLVTIPDRETPPPPPPREPPAPPPQRERPDFAPDLPAPTLDAPDLAGPSVVIDPALLGDTGPVGDLAFEVGELDQPPRAVVRTSPRYPYQATRRRIEGAVRVRFLVGTDGATSAIAILEADPPGVFDDVVREAVASWRFEPGRLAGEAVAAWVVTPVVFDLDGGR